MWLFESIECPAFTYSSNAVIIECNTEVGFCGIAFQVRVLDIYAMGHIKRYLHLLIASPLIVMVMKQAWPYISRIKHCGRWDPEWLRLQYRITVLIRAVQDSSKKFYMVCYAVKIQKILPLSIRRKMPDIKLLFNSNKFSRNVSDLARVFIPNQRCYSSRKGMLLHPKLLRNRKVGPRGFTLRE